MLPVFREYLDNFYLAISGIWLLSQKDIQKHLLTLQDPTLESSIPYKPIVSINLYSLSKKLPQAPFNNHKGVNHFIELQARLAIIGNYDWFKGSVNLKEIHKKHELIQLFKCLRDAAAHDNRFDFRDERIKDNFPLKWHSKLLTKADHGQELFSRWMALGDIELFLEDVSVPLQELLLVK